MTTRLEKRDIEWLATLVSDPDLSPEVREHLAATIKGLLTGEIKFPRGRRAQKDHRRQRTSIAEEVWWAKYTNGWKKVEAAIRHVAGKYDLSPRTVWEYWSGFDSRAYEQRLEEAAADEALGWWWKEGRAEEAIAWLTENEGAAREFTDDEIEAAAKVLENMRGPDDY